MFTGIDAALDRIPDRRGDAVLGTCGIQVDDAYFRQHRVGYGATFHDQAFVTPRLCMGEGFKRGRGAAQDDGNALVFGAIHRQIARRIAHALLLLERGVVLLVNHDQAQAWQ